MMKCDKCKDPEYLATVFELCEHDPETQRRQMLIAKFFKVYPRIRGLSYEAADVLRMEKNPKIQIKAINAVAEEIEKRPKPGSDDYCITRRRVTEDQVRKIVNEQHIFLEGSDVEREKLAKRKAQEGKEQLYECPSCHNLILITLSKRDKIVSLRVTEEEDNLYTYISSELGVSRSKLLSVMLQAKYKYPQAFS